jgi:hypothetical protein
MICERCQGHGGFRYHFSGFPSIHPCPDCLGSGIAYCCDVAGSSGANCVEHPPQDVRPYKANQGEDSANDGVVVEGDMDPHEGEHNELPREGD